MPNVNVNVNLGLDNIILGLFNHGVPWVKQQLEKPTTGDSQERTAVKELLSQLSGVRSTPANATFISPFLPKVKLPHFFLLHGLSAEECRRLYNAEQQKKLTQEKVHQVLASVAELPVVTGILRREFCRDRGADDNPEGVGLCASIGQLAEAVKSADKSPVGTQFGAIVQHWYTEAMTEIASALGSVCSRMNAEISSLVAEGKTVREMSILAGNRMGEFRIFKRGFTNASQRANDLFIRLQNSTIEDLKDQLRRGQLLPNVHGSQQPASSEAGNEQPRQMKEKSGMQALVAVELVWAACYIHALVRDVSSSGVPHSSSSHLSPLLLRAKHLPSIHPSDIFCDSLWLPSKDDHPLGQVIDDGFDHFAKVLIGRVLVLEWVLYEELSKAKVYKKALQWYGRWAASAEQNASDFLDEVMQVDFWSEDALDLSQPEVDLHAAIDYLRKAVAVSVTNENQYKPRELPSTFFEWIEGAKQVSKKWFETPNKILGVVCDRGAACLLYPKDSEATRNWLSTIASLQQPLFSLGASRGRNLATVALCLQPQSEGGAFKLRLHHSASKILRQAGNNFVAGSTEILKDIESTLSASDVRWSLQEIFQMACKILGFTEDVVFCAVIREVIHHLVRISQNCDFEVGSNTTYFTCVYSTSQDVKALPHSTIKHDRHVKLDGTAATFQELKVGRNTGWYWCLKAKDKGGDRQQGTEEVVLFKPFAGPEGGPKVGMSPEAQWKEMRRRVWEGNFDVGLEFVGRHTLTSNSRRQVARILRGGVLPKQAKSNIASILQLFNFFWQSAPPPKRGTFTRVDLQ